LTGGEPLLREDLINRTKDIRSIANGLSIDTNGLLADYSIRKLLLTYYDQVNISVDGPKNVHDHLRRKVGAFETTIGNITKLIKEKRDLKAKTKICSTTVVTKLLDSSAVRHIVRTLSNIGIESMRFIPVMFKKEKSSDKEMYMLSSSSWHEISIMLLRMKKEYPQIEMNKKMARGIFNIFKRIEGINVESNKTIRCTAGEDQLFVDAYGNVWPCCILTHSSRVRGLSLINALKNSTRFTFTDVISMLANQDEEVCNLCTIKYLSKV
jgi:MoaA/NifB/PqqE/SkfB family radical SAM enzyme